MLLDKHESPSLPSCPEQALLHDFYFILSRQATTLQGKTQDRKGNTRRRWRARRTGIFDTPSTAFLGVVVAVFFPQRWADGVEDPTGSDGHSRLDEAGHSIARV